MSPFRAVRVRADVRLTLEARCQAYLQRMRPCEVFTHRTAALLHGLPLPPSADERLDVGALVPFGLPRSSAVRGHRINGDRVQTTVRRGLRVVTAPDAWCQLASELTVRELVVAGDGLVRRQHPLATLESLHAAVTRHALGRGQRKLKERSGWSGREPIHRRRPSFASTLWSSDYQSPRSTSTSSIRSVG